MVSKKQQLKILKKFGLNRTRELRYQTKILNHIEKDRYFYWN